MIDESSLAPPDPGTRAHPEIQWTVHGMGPPLLLIAGTGYGGGTWSPEIVKGFAERHTVVTYDHRGTGSTPGSPDRYTTRLFAGDAAAVLEEVARGSADIVGHSMGGRVAQWLAHDRPELVRALVLAASGPGRTSAARHVADGIPISTVLALVELGYEGYIRDLQRKTFFTPEFADAFPDRVRWLGDAFWSDRPTLEDYLKHVEARQSHDSAGILARIRLPTLVVVGDRDTHEGGTGSHLAQSRYLADHLPTAELRLVEGVRHGLFWEAPDRLVRLIEDWLAEQETTQ